MHVATAPRTRKPRGPGRLSPQHLDYLRYRQAGNTQKQAALAAHVSIAKAKRAEKHPDGQRYLAEVAENARIEGHYGLVEAVKEVDKAIGFAYEQENPNAIAKLLEHKSKLYGLLIEKIDIKTTYIDLKGALEDAKTRVLVHLNTIDRGLELQNRGISEPINSTPSPTLLPKGNALHTDCLQSDPPTEAWTTPQQPQDDSCLQKQGLSMDTPTQAETSTTEEEQQVVRNKV